jgi:hypothetical protein
MSLMKELVEQKLFATIGKVGEVRMRKERKIQDISVMLQFRFISGKVLVTGILEYMGFG